MKVRSCSEVCVEFLGERSVGSFYKDCWCRHVTPWYSRSDDARMESGEIVNSSVELRGLLEETSQLRFLVMTL